MADATVIRAFIVVRREWGVNGPARGANGIEFVAVASNSRCRRGRNCDSDGKCGRPPKKGKQFHIVTTCDIRVVARFFVRSLILIKFTQRFWAKTCR